MGYKIVWLCTLWLSQLCLASKTNVVEDIAMRRVLQAVPGGQAGGQMIEINGQLFHLVPAPQPASNPQPPNPPVGVGGGGVQATPQAPVTPAVVAQPQPQPAVPQPAVPLPQPAVPQPQVQPQPQPQPAVPQPPLGWPTSLQPAATTTTTLAPVPPVRAIPPPPPFNIPGFATQPQVQPQPQPPVQAQTTTTAAPVMPAPPGGWPAGINIPGFGPSPGSTTPAAPVQPAQATPPAPPAPPAQGIWTSPAVQAPLPLPLPVPVQAPPTTTTTRLPLVGHVYGAFGQDCPAPTGIEQCQTTAGMVSDSTGGNAPGTVQCNHASDCCMCRSIKCGLPGGVGCGTLTLQGESAAFGVKDIQIIGGDPSVGGAKLECTGLKSCQDSRVMATAVNQVRCLGRHSCQNAVIVIDHPGLQFTLECSVTSSCQGLTIELNYPGPPSGNVCDPDPASIRDIMLGDVICAGVDSCKDLKFTITNNGCHNLIINNVECREDNCLGAAFNFFGKSAIGIQSCQLPASSIVPVQGLERCFANLRQLTCPDQGSCMNQVRTITDPINGFFLECTSSMACAGAQFTFEVSAGLRTPPTEQIRILCNSPMACQGMIVNVKNANTVPVYLEVTCSGQAACDDATFNSGRNAYVPEVSCGSVSECNNCKFNNQNCGGHAPVLSMSQGFQYPMGPQLPGQQQAIPPSFASQLLPGTPVAVPQSQSQQQPLPIMPNTPWQPITQSTPITPGYTPPTFSPPTFSGYPIQSAPAQAQPSPVQPQPASNPNSPYTPWWLQPQQQMPINQGPQFVYNPNPFI